MFSGAVPLEGLSGWSEMTAVIEIRANALRSLIPPPRLRLSEWIEREIVLPEGSP